MIVEITNSSGSHSWYKNCIGERFEVKKNSLHNDWHQVIAYTRDLDILKSLLSEENYDEFMAGPEIFFINDDDFIKTIDTDVIGAYERAMSVI